METKEETSLLYVKEFIEIFEHPEKHKKRIDELKKNGNKIKILTDEIVDTYGQGYGNYVIEGAKLEALKKANENAKKQNFTCAFTAGFTVEQAIIASSKINGWVEEIQSARKPNGEPLTPFEKVVYAMEICTEFYYNMEEKGADPKLSRNINHVLTGDKIVCQGYANLMTKILTGLGIGCETLHLDTIPTKNMSIDDWFMKGHASCLIYLDDEKYGIKGFFVCEPTGASRRKNLNGAKNGFHRYAFLTIEQAKKFYKEHMGLDLTDFNLNEAKKYAIKVADPELARLKEDYEKQIKYPTIHPKHIKEEFEKKKQAILLKLKQMLKEVRKEIPAPTQQKGEFYSFDIEYIIDSLWRDMHSKLLIFLKECCEQDTDENIISEIESGLKISDFYIGFDDEHDKPYGTEQDVVKYEEFLKRDALPIDNRGIVSEAIFNVCRAKKMPIPQSWAHVMALNKSYDKQREDVCAQYFAEHGASPKERDEVIKLIKAMEKNKEFDSLYVGHGL